jgi:hypothetical protein
MLEANVRQTVSFHRQRQGAAIAAKKAFVSREMLHVQGKMTLPKRSGSPRRFVVSRRLHSWRLIVRAEGPLRSIRARSLATSPINFQRHIWSLWHVAGQPRRKREAAWPVEEADRPVMLTALGVERSTWLLKPPKWIADRVPPRRPAETDC